MVPQKCKSSTNRPDSGWSWVIAGSCCFINMMMYGMMRLAGVLFVATYQKFPVSRQKASLPYSLSSTMRNASGPLVGLLGHLFGVRLVTGAGAVLGTFGIAMCFLARDVTWITIFWGIIFGLGFGLGNVLLPVSINQYFDKHRATASGISLSGACLGSFFLPPLVDLLLEQYGLDGTFLIISGLVLNCVPFAMLLRKPNFDISQTSGTSKTSHSGYKEANIERMICFKQENSKCALGECPKTTFSSGNLDGNCFYNPGFTPEEVRTMEISVTENGEKPPLDVIVKDSQWRDSKSISPSLNVHSPEIINNLPANSDYSCHEIAKDLQQREVNHQISSTYQHPSKPQSTWSRSMTLITNPMFVLISVSVALYGFTFVCVITAIVDFAKDIGIEDSQAKYVVMCFSVGDLIGRLGLGWITDRGYLTKSAFSALCFLLQGIAATAVIWSFDFWSLLSIMWIYGVFEAGLIVIFPILIAQYIDQDLQTIAIPSSNVLYGPACLGVPLTIGFFREQMGSYDGVFYTVGCISLVFSAAWWMVAIFEKCKKSGKETG